MERDKTITLTLRMPESTNAYLREKAREIGVSQNALILMLMNIGIKVYERSGSSASDGDFLDIPEVIS